MNTKTKFWQGTTLLYILDGFIPWMPEGASLGLPSAEDGDVTQKYSVKAYHVTIEDEDTVTVHIQVK